MSSRPPLKGQLPAFGDPYELLGLAPGASDDDITKKFRQLALKLHPDKQKGALSAAQSEKLNKQFHDINEARSFLLDPDNREWRLKHEVKLASERLRREENERRERGMSEHRKKLREELRKKEDAEEKAKRKNSQQQQPTEGGVTKRKRGRDGDDDHLDKLRKEGSKMREDYAQRTANEAAAQYVQQRKQEKARLEERQVRLKWSRSRIQISPSEHSLAELLSRFGSVERVEMIGSKGNSALVTFVDASSCRPCVDAYADSDEMRATHVGQNQSYRTPQDNDDDEKIREKPHDDKPISTTPRDSENLQERKIRQAEERERLKRQMEEADHDGGPGHSRSTKGPLSQPPKPSSSQSTSQALLFPLSFPDTPEYMDLAPWQKLERAEQLILGGILPIECLRRLHYSASNSVN